jgi:broad specificity phosphatase PhoE
MQLERMTLVRHGETLGESSVRFHGKTNVALSAQGYRQAEAARGRLRSVTWDVVVASPLSRAWKTATIIAAGRWVQLEAGFREIDFGRWEGLTKEEIETRDPELYREWQSQVPVFDFPDGERREDFRSRVTGGLERILALPLESALVVAHKGVVRTIVEALTQESLVQPHPELGEVLHVARQAGRFDLLDASPRR